MSEAPDRRDEINDDTPTFIISILAVQLDDQDKPKHIRELCATLTRHENLLADYGLTIASVKVEQVPARGAGDRLGDYEELPPLS